MFCTVNIYSNINQFLSLPFLVTCTSPCQNPLPLVYSNLPTLFIEVLRFQLEVGKIPWRRKWQPTPVLLPGESHGRKSLVGYSPWGRQESDMTERLHFPFVALLGLPVYCRNEGGNYTYLRLFTALRGMPVTLLQIMFTECLLDNL